MLDLRLLSRELLDRKEELIGGEREESSLLEEYEDRLTLIDGLDKRANERLPPYSGSKVLEEGALIRHMPVRFRNRDEATDWAMKVLKNRTVAAVDGSQIYASRSYSMPIGLAQSGLVINRHTGVNGFSKSYLLSLVFPKEFDEHGGMSAYSTAPVSIKRHQLEYKAAMEFMRKEPGNLIFLDGSIILSFINQMDDKARTLYAGSVIELLRVSEETRTPVVAYTDMSLNRDLVTMMFYYFGLRRTTNLSDARLLVGEMNWGDRTRAFLSDRDDRDLEKKKSVLDLYGPYRDSIAFFYMQSSGHLPSKVEVPKWVHEAGMIDDIADVIRAQCIVRPGYPDIIHRAHEYTAISSTEAGQFDRMLDRFAADNQIKIYRSAKELNKRL